MSRCIFVASVTILLVAGSMSAQDAKASVRIINDTDDTRTVEINKFAVKVKAKSEEIVTVPAGEFTCKVIGVDAEPQKRTVESGKTWSMTIRATVTVLPSDKEKPLPPDVVKVGPKTGGDEKAAKVEKPDWDKSKQAKLVIKLPAEENTIWVDGREMPAKKTLERTFTTPDLNGHPKGTIWYYKIAACWVDNKGNKRHVTQYVSFRCGEEVCVNFANISFAPPPIYFGPPVYFGGCGR